MNKTFFVLSLAILLTSCNRQQPTASNSTAARTQKTVTQSAQVTPLKITTTSHTSILQKKDADIETITVQGNLKHFPADVKSAEAWYGHNFMLNGTPILPSEAVPEEVLKKHINQQVTVSGYWYEGTQWIPTEEEKMLPLPVDPEQGIVIRGEGLRAFSISLSKE